MRAFLILLALVAAPVSKQAPVIAAVKAQLKDPDSAKFRGVKEYEPGYWCGWVNAKNGYGGYTGYSIFMFHDGKAAIIPPEDSDTSLCPTAEPTR